MKVHRSVSSPAERILAAADKLFYAEGIRAVGVDTVAAEAGVSKRTLYNHYPSKDALIAAYLTARFKHLAPSDAPAREQILGNSTAERLIAAVAASGGCPYVNAVTRARRPQAPRQQDRGAVQGSGAPVSPCSSAWPQEIPDALATRPDPFEGALPAHWSAIPVARSARRCRGAARRGRRPAMPRRRSALSGSRISRTPFCEPRACFAISSSFSAGTPPAPGSASGPD